MMITKQSTCRIPFSSDIHLPLVFLGVFACLIITASSLVIVLVYSNKWLRTTTNLYLAYLALSDLLSGLIAIPLIFAWNLMLFADNIAACIACMYVCHGSCISVFRLLHDTASGDCHFWALCDDNPPNAVPQDHFQANNSGFNDPHLDFCTEFVIYWAVLDQPRLHPNARNTSDVWTLFTATVVSYSSWCFLLSSL